MWLLMIISNCVKSINCCMMEWLWWMKWKVNHLEINKCVFYKMDDSDSMNILKSYRRKNIKWWKSNEVQMTELEI